MPLNKRFTKLCLRDNGLKRGSFDERICDDLSEVILQYLPIKDKSRFERVSKQFQRTVFQKQYELQIIDSKYLESILKKCPKINSIDFKRISYKDSERVVELIDKYCNQLIEISGHLDLSNKGFEKLVQKFNLNSFTVKDMQTNYLFLLMNSLEPIKELHLKQSINFNNDDLYCVRNITLNNLKTASIYLSSSKDLNSLKYLLENNERLEKLEITFIDWFDRTDPKQMDTTFNIIANLKHLVELKINSDESLSYYCLKSGFIQIANFSQIKSLSLHIRIIDSKFISILSTIKSLKRLDLNINYERFSEMFCNSQLIYLIKAVNGFQKLTHLTLIENQRKTSADIFLENIDINLPNLQYFETNLRLEGRKSTIDTLCRLSKLETIKVNLSVHRHLARSFRKEVSNRLIENCKYIRNITLNSIKTHFEYYFH